MRYGLDDRLGLVTYVSEHPLVLGRTTIQSQHLRLYSEQSAAQADDAMTRLLNLAFERATAIPTTNRAMLVQPAAHLMKQKTVPAGELPSSQGDG